MEPSTDGRKPASELLSPNLARSGCSTRSSDISGGQSLMGAHNHSTFAVFGSRADAGDGGSGALFPCRTWLA